MQYIQSALSQGSVTVVRLNHAINFLNVSAVRKEYAKVTKGRVVQSVVFDLRDVPCADSSSLAALIDLVKYMKNHRICGEVGLCNLSTEAKDLIGIMKVQSLFGIYSSVEEAIQTLG